MSNVKVWTSTTNESIIASEDNIFGRYKLSRMSGNKIGPKLKLANMDSNLLVTLKTDYQIRLGKAFFPNMKYILDHIALGSDYALRKLTLMYDGKDFFLLGGNTWVQACLQVDVISNIAANEPFAIELPFDDIYDLTRALSSEFKIVETLFSGSFTGDNMFMFMKSEDKKRAGVMSEDTAGDGTVITYRYILTGIRGFNVDIASSGILNIFNEYERPDAINRPIYRIMIDNKIKSMLAAKHDKLELVHRHGLLSLRMPPENGSTSALEVYTASPIMTVMNGVPLPKDGEIIASVSGKDVYDAISLKLDSEFSLDVLGSINEGKLDSPCVIINGNKTKVLISQSLEIIPAENIGFAIKQNRDFVPSTEKESLEKAIKSYKTKELTPEQSELLQNVLQKLEDVEKALKKTVARVDSLTAKVDHISEPAIIEAPEMMKTLSELPAYGRKTLETVDLKFKNYIVSRPGTELRLSIIEQELDLSLSTINSRLETLVEKNVIVPLDTHIFYIPKDVEKRINLEQPSPKIDERDIPVGIRKKYSKLDVTSDKKGGNNGKEISISGEKGLV